MTTPPSPLTPADCDLRDFPFMPVETDRVLKSETWIMGTGDERAAAISLWFQSWHQVPAGSLPNKDEVLAHLAVCAKWKKVKAHALRGWVLCSDGRLYHPVVCEKVLEAWVEKLLNSLSGTSGNAKRWGVEIDVTAIRAQLLLAIGMLRDLAPGSKSLKKKAVVSIVAGSPPDVGKPSPPDSPPDSLGDRKGQGQGQGQGLTHKGRSGTSPGGAPAADDFAPTKAGQIGKAMKAAGIPPDQINLADPVFMELVRQGATVDEFAGIAREAADKQLAKPWKWVLATLQGRRAEAAQVALAPRVEQAAPTESAYDRRMREQVAEAAGAFADVIAKPAPRAPGAPITIEAEEVIHADGIPRVEHDRAGR